jgi:4-hydroxy-3-polyprenylbenzoate decarboxylase
LPGCENILVAITGASGIAYAEKFLEASINLGVNIEGVILSESANQVSRLELGREPRIPGTVKVYDENDFQAPFASSSGLPECMVIVPASMNTLAKIANGIQDNLIARAAGSMLRMRKKLVVVPRETPLSVIDLENLLKLARAGAVVLPASPGFYHKPETLDDIVDFIAGKILDVLGVDNELYRHWGTTRTRLP